MVSQNGSSVCTRIVVLLILANAMTQACPCRARQQIEEGLLTSTPAVTTTKASATSSSGASAIPPAYRFVSEATLHADPSCLADAYYDQTPTCVVGAIQIAAEQISRLILATEGMAAKFLRLTFHDCVGGCDGCVDLSNPSNFGLQIPIDALAPVVEYNKEFLTTGDVWVLAGLVAARTSQQSTSVVFPMQYVNRPQCFGYATTAGPHRDLPSAHFTTQEVLTFFAETFDFSPQESVAILGAHTLGKAASENSGFGGDGGWDTSPHTLNNDYYKELLDVGQFELDFEDNTAFPPFPSQFYWEEEVPEGAPDGTFMLHADMALAFDMQGFVNPTTGEVNCTMIPHDGKVSCPTSTLLPQAHTYASNNDQWVADFNAAYLKMVSKGCGNGFCQLVE